MSVTTVQQLFKPLKDITQDGTISHQCGVTMNDSVEARCIDDARTISKALGYSMNTVELAIRDGVPYAIDYMNSAPDLDISSLGPEHFAWAVRTMAAHLADLARAPRSRQSQWSALLHAGQE